MIELFGAIIIGCGFIFVFGEILKDVYYTYTELCNEEESE